MHNIALFAFVTVFICCSYCNRNMLVPPPTTDLSPLVKSQISELLLVETGLILLIRTSQDFDNIYVRSFLENSEYPLSIASHETQHTGNFKRLELWNNFVIVTSVDHWGAEALKHVETKGYYFFVINENYLNLESLRPIFHSAWKDRRSLHLYLLTSLGIITYDPFAYNTDRSEYGLVVRLENRKSVGEIFHNLNEYPLRIELFRSVYSRTNIDSAGKLSASGADAVVALELQRMMNFTYVAMMPDNDFFGHITVNGTFNGALGRIINNEIDIALTSYFIKDYFTRDTEFTVAVYSDLLCCYVPKAARVPQSILPLFAFSSAMWMCYCFAAMTCAFIWSTIRCINLVLFKYTATNFGIAWNILQFMQIFVDTWIVWVRVALRKYPGFGSEKLFLASVFLVSVIFGAVFESSLATVYIKPLYYKDITTLPELDASGFKILYKYTSMGDDLFAKGSSDLFTRLESKMRFLVTPESIMTNMVEDGGFASVTRKSSISLESIEYFAANKLYMIPECPKTYTLAYVLPKDSPFATRINLLLLEFLNAGLIDKWINEMYFEAKLHDMKKNVKEVHGAKILTLHDLQLPFYVIAIGAVIGCTTLLGEIFFHADRRLVLRKVSPKHNEGLIKSRTIF